MSFSISGVFLGGGGGKYIQGVGEVDLLTSLSLDSFLIITGSFVKDIIFFLVKLQPGMWGCLGVVVEEFQKEKERVYF